MHAHASWTLLIVDDGMVRYDLHRHEHGALDKVITLLPTQVPHNGRAATSAGFSKRVVYLDLSHLPECLIGHAVDQPVLPDPLLRQRIHQLHHVPGQPGEAFEAENRLAFITERLRCHLSRTDDPGKKQPDLSVAYGLRDLIDARFRERVTLREASRRPARSPRPPGPDVQPGVRNQPASVHDEPAGRSSATTAARRNAAGRNSGRGRVLRSVSPEPPLHASARHKPRQICPERAAHHGWADQSHCRCQR